MHHICFLLCSEESNQIQLVTIRELFRFADRTDSILLTLAVIGSIIYGIIIPAQFILFGKMINDFVAYIINENYDLSDRLPDLEASTTRTAGFYVMLAVGNLVFAWLGMGLFALSAERQVHKMRLAMFQSAIYKNIGWFEMFSVGELNTRFTEEMKIILDGIGSNFSSIISSVVCFGAGYLIGLILCWDLTLILLATFPLMMLCGIVMTKMSGIYTNKELKAYAKAGKIAEQSISSIKTVVAFGGEHHQVKLYDENLIDASKYAIKKAVSLGLGMGGFQLILYADYALSVWYIIKLARETETTPGDALAVFFAVTMGSMILGQTAATCFEALASARGAAFVVFQTIDQKSEIDASSSAGKKLENISGALEFCHVNFAYPRRPAFEVLKEFNLKIPSGKCVALVGESGCGKTTIGKLLQRFYDTDRGSVLLDHQNIKDLNVSHLRRHIGVVNQEPVLFSTTIAENIAFGREGVTQHEIEKAAKIANAHDFIIRFPKGYETLCGERGTQMSGGQKQRIAIARALVRNPKILLLDEATSALDSESEAAVQEAIRKAGQGRTMIIIAHRLSTIRNADIIAVISEGHVVEIGTHEELLVLDGLYSSFVKLQANYDDDVEEDGSSFDDEQFFHITDNGARKLTSLVSTIDGSQAKTLLVFDHVDNIKPISFTKILKWNAQEWNVLVLGCIGAALYGSYPFLYGIAFGGVLHTMRYNSRIEEESESMDHDSKHWAVFFFLIGVESGLGIFLQNWCFSSAGEALTKRLRKAAFSAFLRQDMAYFDSPENGTGVVCSRLATEVSSIQGATGPQLGLFVSSMVTIIGGLIVAFAASWKLTLTMMAFIPIVIIAITLINYFLGANDCGKAADCYAKVCGLSKGFIFRKRRYDYTIACGSKLCIPKIEVHYFIIRWLIFPISIYFMGLYLTYHFSYLS
ncbi:multidrug resistance 1 [Paramuricea clavata]|uniref:Multidrug resistance 1 n=1 Tax=Paramuricea clavata TaxID=317549 RepID=A0A6S7GWS5_PARCT|nr:multidrug resistance 1 [Paramuricea clavata]